MDELHERMVMELHNWKDAASLPDDFRFTKTIAAARQKDLSVARTYLGQMQADAKKRAGEKKGNYTGATDMNVQLRETEAWVAFAEGKTEEALTALKASADYEDAHRLDSFLVPAREMLADMLLEAKRPAEALSEYKSALVNSPGRFNLLYGAGRAAQAAQQNEEARSYFAKLSEMCGAAADRPELSQIRSVLAKN